MELTQSGKYLTATNAKDGDLLTIIDAGVIRESKFTYDDGNPKKEYVFRVKYNGEDYTMNFGKYTRDELMKAYGTDTEKWVGKNAKITIESYRALNKKGIILYPSEELTPEQQAQKVWDDA